MFIEERKGSFSTPYLYNGKELDPETGYYYYGARYYNPRVSQWLSVDPLAEKYPSWSPYAYTFNNPIRFIDPTGMEGENITTKRPPNDYVFDEKGNYVRIEKNNQPHRLVIEDSKTKERTNYYFADPKEDPLHIELGYINKVVFVSEKDIEGMLQQQGAFVSGKFNFAWQSQGGVDFDYSYSVLPNKYSVASIDPLNSYSNALFLPDGDKTVHNQMNFGNYLWAATGYTVGFSYADLQMGAHVNSKFNSRRNEYESQWDSKDDQKSIVLGAFHAARYNYRAKRK